MPTVNDTPIPSAKEFSQALLDAYAGEPTVTDPVRLFATACITSVATGGGSESIAAAAAGKRNPDSRGAISPSPRRKRRQKQSSPKRAALAVAAVVTQLSQPTPGVDNPPTIRRKGPSPTSIINDVFEVQPAPTTAATRSSSTHAFVGYVPKTKLFSFCRGNHFDTKVKYTDEEIQEGVLSCRTRMIYHFTRTSNMDRRGEAQETPTHNSEDNSDGPNTRSSVEELEDWMVDTSAVDLTTTNVRRLSIYPIEQLLLCGERQRLLMVVKQSAADHLLGKGTAKKVVATQGTKPIIISGEYYHRIQCTITGAADHRDARGEGGGAFSQDRFESDFVHKRCGFQLEFDRCNTKQAFTWQDVVDLAPLLKFF